ncbi:MAG: histidine kinase [Gordonia sp. (in: high G+C Gram-positive bacteria)]
MADDNRTTAGRRRIDERRRKAVGVFASARPVGTRIVLRDSWPQTLGRIVIAVALTATAVECFDVIRRHLGMATIIPVVVTTIGVIVSTMRPYVGLTGMAAGPLLALVVGHSPLTSWSVACFGALLLASRGIPALLVGSVTALANLISVAISDGGVSPDTNPAASIAGFSAILMTAIGSSMFAHREYWSVLETQTTQALVSREVAVERGIAEERLRIARDLHDGVGHQIAVVSMHLGLAQVRLPPEAEDAALSLAAARKGIQEVLGETANILTVLRDSRSADDDSEPTPEHSRLGELVQKLVAAGMDIDAEFEGLSRPLSSGRSAAVYRVAQEALTNAQRHGTGRVVLHVSVGEDGSALVEVVNEYDSGAVHPAVRVGGYGLIGMRERAVSAGGHLEASAVGTTFRVLAVFGPQHGGRSSASATEGAPA